jgi:hypothetical protein
MPTDYYNTWDVTAGIFFERVRLELDAEALSGEKARERSERFGRQVAGLAGRCVGKAPRTLSVDPRRL